jgi:predicted transcriptional regulator
MLGDDTLAITTVLTVLSRLGDKEMVQKQAHEGRTMLFKATKTREQHTASMLLSAMENTQNPALVFSHFASQLSEQQIESLKKALG